MMVMSALSQIALTPRSMRWPTTKRPMALGMSDTISSACVVWLGVRR